MLEYRIFFPLYCHVEQIKIGVDEQAIIAPPSPFTMEGKLVFYGTSITQGASASRPGMCYANILSRRLNVETLNYGFSGNGLGEMEVADTLAGIDNPLLYLIDYEANAGLNGKLEETLESFLLCLMKKHPAVPLLVVSRIPHLLDSLNKERAFRREAIRRFQQDTVQRINQDFGGRAYFVDGRTLLPDNGEDTTIDLTHPTDLGFAFMADGLEKTLRKILNLER